MSLDGVAFRGQNGFYLCVSVCVCVSPPQIDQIAHTLYLADTGQAYREQGEVEWWVGVKLNEEEKDGGGGGA